MSRRARKAVPAAAGAARCTVTVCRGCCCGTPKIAGSDHAAQLAGPRRALESTAQVRVTCCLDACSWIEAGGPGLADPPGVLDLYALPGETASSRRG